MFAYCCLERRIFCLVVVVVVVTTVIVAAVITVACAASVDVVVVDVATIAFASFAAGSPAHRGRREGTDSSDRCPVR